MTHTFANSKRRNARRGYIKRMSDGMYLAMEHDGKANRRCRATFDTYMQARSWMFARGLWLEV